VLQQYLKHDQELASLYIRVRDDYNNGCTHPLFTPVFMMCWDIESEKKDKNEPWNSDNITTESDVEKLNKHTTKLNDPSWMQLFRNL
jgi:hypothetical protein